MMSISCLADTFAVVSVAVLLLCLVLQGSSRCWQCGALTVFGRCWLHR
jgi:hypothetical protein